MLVTIILGSISFPKITLPIGIITIRRDIVIEELPII
jgi:hypothetical protein